MIPKQAITLALLGSIYPPALAVAIAIAAGKKVRVRLAIFVSAALCTTFAIGVLIIELFSAIDLESSRHHGSSGVLELVIGIALFVVGLYLEYQRRRRTPGTPKPPKSESRVERAMNSVPLLLLLGVTLYALPSPQYVGAVKAIAGEEVPEARKLVHLAIVAVIMLWMIELPALGLTLFPNRADVVLEKFTGWMQRHGQMLLIVICYVAGAWMIANGLLHVTS